MILKEKKIFRKMFIVTEYAALSAHMVKRNEMPQNDEPVNYLSASVNPKQFWIEIRLDVSCKQFGSRLGPTHVGPDLDPNCLILKVFLMFLLFF